MTTIKIKVAEFLKELQASERFLSDRQHRKANFEFADYIVPVFKNNKVTLWGTNGTGFFKTEIPTDTNEEIEIAVNRKLFLNALSAINKEEAELSIVNDKVNILARNENGQIVFNSMLSLYPTNDLPTFPNIDSGEWLSIDAETLKETLNKVFCVEKGNTSRVALQGVSLKKVGDSLHFDATDAHRLSHVELTDNFETNMNDFNVIIYQQFVNEIKRYSTGKVLLKFNEDKENITAVMGNRTIILPLLQAQYPDVLRLFPKEHAQTLKLEIGDFKESLKGVSFIAEQNNSRLFTVKISDKVELTAQNSETESSAMVRLENVEIENTDTELELSLDIHYVKEALSTFNDNQEVKVDLTQQMIILQDVENNSYRHLLLGLRK